MKAINQHHREALIDAVIRVIDSGWYVLGQEVNAFEQEFAAYCGTSHCVGMANGLDALVLTLRAWKEMGKLQEGDEVIVPANTYIASVLAIIENRLKPVLVESEKGSFNLCPDKVRAANLWLKAGQGNRAQINPKLWRVSPPYRLPKPLIRKHTVCTHINCSFRSLPAQKTSNV